MKRILTVPSKKFIEASLKIKSWQPVIRNGWIIKFAVFLDSHILLFFISQRTAQTIIREFEDENDAVDFINYVINLDYTVTQEIV